MTQTVNASTIRIGQQVRFPLRRETFEVRSLSYMLHENPREGGRLVVILWNDKLGKRVRHMRADHRLALVVTR